MKPNKISLTDVENAAIVDWSRKQLEMAPGDAASTHRQVCDFLKSSQFRPSATVRPAVVGALRPQHVLRSVIIREIVAREMLSRFSAVFFELTPEVRDQRLNALSEHMKEFPQLTWRLQLLRSGASIEGSVPRGEDRASQLAASAADVFVMSPEAAARAGREEFVDQSAARKKRAVASVASRALSSWIKLPPPNGLSQGQRLDLATSRPKHLRPIGEYGKAGFLLVVIFAAFLRIALMPRPPAGGSFNRPSYTNTVAPSMPAFQQKQVPVPAKSMEAMAMLLGKEEFEAYLKAQSRLEDARKRMEEIKGKSRQQRQAQAGAAEAFADKWQETYNQLQASDGDLQKFLEEQKARNERVLNGNPFRTNRGSPVESDADTLIPRSSIPGSNDPAQQVDDFLDKLNGVQTGRARP